MILCGPTGSGKSSSLSTLVEALAKMEAPGSVSVVSENTQGAPSEVSAGTASMGAVSHRLIRMNPKAIDNQAQMFGYNSGTEWIDGLFTTVLRKASQVSS